MTEPNEGGTEFEKAAKAPETGVFAEVVGFLRENKKWWLVPILVVIVVFSVVIALGATGAAPFIYTLF